MLIASAFSEKSMNEHTAISIIRHAEDQLTAIQNLEEGIDYLNKVKAIQIWARAEKKDAELQRMLAEQRIRTQRLIGSFIRMGREKGELASGGQFYSNQHLAGNLKEPPKTLSSLGLSKKQSSLFQRLSEIENEAFELIIRQGRAKSRPITAHWVLQENDDAPEATEHELVMLQRLRSGKAIVINDQKDHFLKYYARKNGLYLYVGPGSVWQNPFIAGQDGTYEEVLDLFVNQYFPHKRQLRENLALLKGKVLAGSYYPKPNHASFLVNLVD